MNQEPNSMLPIKIEHYASPQSPWIGCITTNHWIAFEHKDGSVLTFRRNPDGSFEGQPAALPGSDDAELPMHVVNDLIEEIKRMGKPKGTDEESTS